MKRLLILLALWPSLASAGTKYFVRPSGSDVAAGTSWETAWATNDKVQSTVVAGDSVFYGKGWYWNSRIVPPAGGSNSNWIVYACSTYFTGTTNAEKLAGAGLAIWSGGEMVTGWTLHSGSIYKAPWLPSHTCDEPSGFAAVLTQGSQASQQQLVKVGSLATVTTAGEYYHTTTGDSIYAWFYGSSDPSSDTIIASCRFLVNYLTTNANHIRFFGIGMRHAWTRVYQYHNTNPQANIDSTFLEHAKIAFAGGLVDENTALIGSGGHGGAVTRDYNYVRSCTLASAINYNDGGSGTPPGSGLALNTSGVIIYLLNRFVMESCLVVYPMYDGVFVKDSIFNSTIRFNTLVGVGGQGAISTYADCFNDSIYGNIVDSGAVCFRMDNEETAATDSVFWYNNTCYDCSNAMYAQQWGSGVMTGRQIFKYNVGYKMGSSVWGILDNAGATTFWHLDSNKYYDSPASTSAWRGPCIGGNETWTQWRTDCGWDVHSDTINPGLTDPAGGDFSRPNASGEMNLTYGGQTWTKFGAVQGAFTGSLKIYQTTMAQGKFYCVPKDDE